MCLRTCQHGLQKFFFTTIMSGEKSQSLTMSLQQNLLFCYLWVEFSIYFFHFYVILILIPCTEFSMWTPTCGLPEDQYDIDTLFPYRYRYVYMCICVCVFVSKTSQQLFWFISYIFQRSAEKPKEFYYSQYFYLLSLQQLYIYLRKSVSESFHSNKYEKQRIVGVLTLKSQALKKHTGCVNGCISI